MPIAIISHVGLLIIGIASILLRRQAVLLAGRTLLIINTVFVLGVAAPFLVQRAPVRDLTNTWFLLLALAISFMIRRSWILFGYDDGSVPSVLEECMSRILLDYQKLPDGYVLKGRGGEEARLRIRRLPLGCAILALDDPAHLKKARVLQDLLRKNFAGVFPRLVIHL